MKHSATFIFVFLVFCAGCASRGPQRRLDKVMEAMEKNDMGLAVKLFGDIDVGQLRTAADSAYYSCLGAYVYMCLNDSFPEPMIDAGIKYYERRPSPRRLKYAYYARSWSLYNSGRRHEAMVLMKKSEQLTDVRDTARMYKVCHALACFNQEAGEYRGTLRYGWKGLAYAEGLPESPDCKVRTMIQVIMAYMALDETDSALTCARRIEPVLFKQINPYSTYYYLACLADLYYPVDRRKAMGFLNKALEYNPDVEAFRMVGKVYFDNGEYAKAREYYTRSLDARHPEVVVPAMEGLVEIARLEKRYEDMNHLSKELSAFKDSVVNARKEQRMSETQTAFDAKVREKKLTGRLYTALAGIGVLVLCIIAGWFIYRRYRKLSGRQLDSARRQLASKEKKLEKMSAEGAGRRKEIKSLREKIETLEENNTETYANGIRLYNGIKDGGTTVKWTRTDFADFMAYYKILDPEFVTHLERDYNNLSTRYMFAAVLERMGKTDGEIERIMGIAGSSLRSIRSRTRSGKAEKNE